MSSLQPISFTHYLAAKKTVDDRALNRHVWEALANRVRSAGRLRVLELGAGIGTMVERAWEWGLLTGEVAYTLLDADAACIAAVPERLTAWAKGRGIEAERLGERRLQLRGGARRVTLDFVAADALEFAQRDHAELWDMLIAHAFLDLIDVPAALPHLLALLRPGGLFYFTLNFDGVTTFEPVLDPALDAQIEHRTAPVHPFAPRGCNDPRRRQFRLGCVPRPGGLPGKRGKLSARHPANRRECAARLPGA